MLSYSELCMSHISIWLYSSEQGWIGGCRGPLVQYSLLIRPHPKKLSRSENHWLVRASLTYVVKLINISVLSFSLSPANELLNKSSLALHIHFFWKMKMYSFLVLFLHLSCLQPLSVCLFLPYALFFSKGLCCHCDQTLQQQKYNLCRCETQEFKADSVLQDLL